MRGALERRGWGLEAAARRQRSATVPWVLGPISAWPASKPIQLQAPPPTARVGGGSCHTPWSQTTTSSISPAQLAVSATGPVLSDG